MRPCKLLTLTLCACLLESAPGFAAAPVKSEAELEILLQQISAQTTALQEEVKKLKAELTAVKQQKQKSTKQVIVVKQSVPATQNQSASDGALTVVAGPNITTTASGESSGYHPGELISPDIALNDAGHPILTANEEIQQEKEADITYLMGSYVMTSTVLNIHSAYDASDLIVNQSTMNEDLRFLQQRQTLEDLIGPANLPSVGRPEVFLSGKVEGIASYISPYSGSSMSDINVNSAELDVLAEASPWAFGFLSMAFDPSQTIDPLIIGSGDRVGNSNIFLKRGFLTIGNLDKSPVYLTVGQQYVPFGRYSTYTLSSPDTQILGRTNVRAALVGLTKDGFFMSGYGYDGAADMGNIDDTGVNVGYKYSSGDKYNFSLGAGYINDMADSQGIQDTNGAVGSFQGFAQTLATENIAHTVPGVDLNASFGIGPFNFIAEYITQTRSYAPQDLQFNGRGAKMEAGHLEADYSFYIFDKHASLTFAYEQSAQALAIGLPKNSYVATFNTSIWKNTIATLEYRYDQNYASTDTSAGICELVTGVVTTCPGPAGGGNQNTVLAQLGVYF